MPTEDARSKNVNTSCCRIGWQKDDVKADSHGMSCPGGLIIAPSLLFSDTHNTFTEHLECSCYSIFILLTATIPYHLL